MYIRKRGNRWQARVNIKGFPEQTKTCGSVAEAQSWGAEVEKQMAEGGYTTPDKTTLAGALARYKDSVTAAKKGSRQEGSIIKNISAHPIAALPLVKVRGADLAAYRDWMKARGSAPATIGRHLAVLSAVFNTARREWAIEMAGNPVQAIKKPTIRNARSRRLEGGELAKILAASDSRDLRDIVQLAVETAMRRSEMVALRWQDVDKARRVVTLHDTKNGEKRVVPLSSRALEVLQGRQSLPARIDGRIFGVANNSVSQAFVRACGRAGVVGLRFHDLRHEATTRLFELGLNQMEVAAITGHKTLSMLQRYTHLKPEDLARRLG